MTTMRYEEFEPWEKSFHTVPRFRDDRGDAYEAFKREKANLIIDSLEQKFPNIRSNIKAFYTSTPLTYRDYIGAPKGGLYGSAKDVAHPLKSFVSPRTKVSNLFYTGQHVNLHGILGVTISSIVTCSEFVGMDYLLKKIRNA